MTKTYLTRAQNIMLAKEEKSGGGSQGKHVETCPQKKDHLVKAPAGVVDRFFLQSHVPPGGP